MSKKIVTICYGERKEWDSRNKATEFFLDCMMCSDGSEKERYANVLVGLMSGLDVCSDGC